MRHQSYSPLIAVQAEKNITQQNNVMVIVSLHTYITTIFDSNMLCKAGEAGKLLLHVVILVLVENQNNNTDTIIL